MFNSFLGIGRIGKDAEILNTRTGNPMARFSIAIERFHKRGEIVEPDWIPCQLFGDRAMSLAPYLTKGSLIGIRGRMSSFRAPGETGELLHRIQVWELDFLRRPANRGIEGSQPAA